MSAAFDETLLSRVEDAGLNASAPRQQRWIDGWLVRYCPGKAKRARCINAVAPGRLALDARLALANEVFRAAQLPLVVRITPFTQPPDLDDTLAARGWHAFDDTRVMLLPAITSLPAVRPLPDGCALVPAAPPRYAQVVGALRGTPPEQSAAHADRLAASPVPYEGWLLQRGDEVLACAQTAAESALVGVYDVYTAESARGHGLATSLCARLLQMAAARGAQAAYLQVDAANAPARAVYSRLGFRDGYAYHYRSPDAGAA